MTLAIVIDQYKKERSALAKWIGNECDLQALDEWKQKGFYTHYGLGGQFISPSDIDTEFSHAVFQLAQRIVDGINFLLKDNIDNYKARIKIFRESISDKQLLRIREHADKLVNEIFGIKEEDEQVSS